MNTLTYTKTRLYSFWNWWIMGLLYLIPGSLQRLANLSKDYITIEFNNEKVIFKHYRDDRSGQLEEKYFLLDHDEIQKTAIIGWLNEQQQKGMELFLLVSEDHVLQKTITLPTATEDNLHQVLCFEMDRRTPFRTDQVYFDYFIENKNVVENQLHIQLFVTPKNKIDMLLNKLDSWGIKINAVSIKENIKALNLLPVEKQLLIDNRKEKNLTLILTATVFCLFMALLYLPLLKHEKSIDKLTDMVAESRAITLKLKNLKDQKDAILERSSFLISKRNNNIPVIEVINELSVIIPDDTWLTHFTITKGELQLQGESKSASSIIPLIESSDKFMEARFRAPVTRNNVSNNDKFNLTARLVQ